MQQTSLLAYRDIQPLLGDKQMTVYSVFQEHMWLCNQEVAELLHWPINTVTPRVKELVEQGLVKAHHKDTYRPTNRKVIYWSIK